MRMQLVAIAVAGLLGGCLGGHVPTRYESIDQICALPNYWNYTLVEKLGNATPPFMHSESMDQVVNKGAGKKSVTYLERGAKVPHDLSKYDQQVLVSFWTDDHDNSLVLVMTRDDN